MHKTIFVSGARDAGAHTSESITASGYVGARFFLDVSAISSTGTVTPKVQVYDGTASTWVDLPGATYAAINTTGGKTLSVRPGVAETANESVSDALADQIRVIATVATSTVTFSLGVDLVR